MSLPAGIAKRCKGDRRHVESWWNENSPLEDARDLKGRGLGGTALGGAGGPAGNHPRGLGGGSVDRDQQTNIFHLSVTDLGYPGEVHVQGRGGRGHQHRNRNTVGPSGLLGKDGDLC